MSIHEDSYQRIINNLEEGLYFVNKDRVITYWNKGAERITGFSAEEVIGSKCSDNILNHIDEHGTPLCMGHCPLHASIEDGESRQNKVYLRRKDGIRIPVFVRTANMMNDEGEIIGGAEIFSDLSPRESLQQRIKLLEEIALVDELTNVPNRRYMQEDISRQLTEYERNGVSFGVLFLDVDHFKKFNDTYGHETGDQILKTISETMSRSARPYDVYGRWGGEEFVGVIQNIRSEQLQAVAERLRELIKNSFIMVDRERCFATVSIGATVCKTGDTLESIVKRADELMYQSKKNGRDRVTLG